MKILLKAIVVAACLFYGKPASATQVVCQNALGATCLYLQMAQHFGLLKQSEIEFLDSSDFRSEVLYVGKGAFGTHPACMFQMGLYQKHSLEDECVLVALFHKRPNWDIFVRSDAFKRTINKSIAEVRGQRINGLFAGLLVGGTGCQGFPTTTPMVLEWFSAKTGQQPPPIKCGESASPGVITMVNGNSATRWNWLLQGKVDLVGVVTPLTAIFRSQIDRKDEELKGIEVFARMKELPPLSAAGLTVKASLLSDANVRKSIRTVACAHLKAVALLNDKVREPEVIAYLIDHLKRFNKIAISEDVARYVLSDFRDLAAESGKLSEGDMLSMKNFYFDTHDNLARSSGSDSARTLRAFWSTGRTAPFWDFSLVPTLSECQ